MSVIMYVYVCVVRVRACALVFVCNWFKLNFLRRHVVEFATQ